MELGALIGLAIPPLVLFVIGARSLLRRAHILDAKPGDVLIIAAHPDDCAILAGAYATYAHAAGRRVRVAYVTCGAARPDLPRAITRCREARAAWSQLALVEDDFVFFDLPEHHPGAQSTWQAADRDRVREGVTGLLRQLPSEAQVFVPAPGESHVDHRGLRQLSLEAWRLSARPDLKFWEGPEYNDYLSLVGAPGKTMLSLASRVPGISRWVSNRGREPWAGFPGAGSYWELPFDEERMERRRTLLRTFASEDAPLLVRLFGWHERYRPIADADRGLAAEPPRGHLYVSGKFRDASAVLLVIVAVELLAVVAATACSLALRLSHQAGWMQASILTAAVGAFALGLRRGVPVETRLFYWALAAGALAARWGAL